MDQIDKKEIVLSLIAMTAIGISPNMAVAAGAGYFLLSSLFFHLSIAGICYLSFHSFLRSLQRHG